ncbi:hypothetical protein ISN44_As05g024660 [Arabidopsis suecica]|uniref:Uncharacterized protein n=1 Tax=Arabidopsis suecica TaxID=45249 RepID=A0A8T2DFZ2_ARASU|nr:hypothetical protein ISN44_As05g024660 [Arabidopsis suecica]
MVSLNPQKQTFWTMTFQMAYGWTVGDDDAERVLGPITSQLVSFMKLILCQDIWSSLVCLKDLLKYGKKLSSKDAKVEIITKVMLFVFILKKVAKPRFSRKTLVWKPWYHYVYVSELYLNTSDLQLRFAKRNFSHKMLHANRNEEKSNMKLDNNRSYDRLASKTTLRKASLISLLLYFS